MNKIHLLFNILFLGILIDIKRFIFNFILYMLISNNRNINSKFVCYLSESIYNDIIKLQNFQ